MRDREPVPRRFVQLDGGDAVELPYQGGRLAMWLIVPHDAAGLPAIEESLESQDLSGLGAIAQQGYVDLTMPKWEQTLPPTDLFEWLYPWGFCAGAPATAMAFQESAGPQADLTVVADQPFLWAIVHPETGALLHRTPGRPDGLAELSSVLTS